MLPEYIRREGKSLRNDKWIIGLIMEDMGSNFAKDLIKDVIEALPEDDSIRLVIISGKYDDPGMDMHEYRLVYNTIHRLDELCEFDGLLVSCASFAKIMERAHEEGADSRILNIPKIFVGEGPENETIVKCDNEIGIRLAIDFLVNINGCRKLCMLGGRDDIYDAVKRREVFKQSLADNGLIFSEQCYVGADMSENCIAEAEHLLDLNPDMDAVFCVNDASAVAMYAAMRKRGLVPGSDIQVFGFDNTREAGTMEPPLSSVGTEGATAGSKIVELLLKRLNGETTQTVMLPTRLYGRESLKFATYDYSENDLQMPDTAVLDRMFDDCFYRYKNEKYKRENVDLRRLFREFMKRMLGAAYNRFMSEEEFGELLRLADIFIENGALDYTDIRKLMKSIDRLQEAINSSMISGSFNSKINRVFLRIKDKVIEELAMQRELDQIKRNGNREKLEEFCLRTVDYIGTPGDNTERIIRNISGLGLETAAFYLFENPIVYENDKLVDLPDEIRLVCVVKDGVFYMIPEGRQTGPLKTMFSRDELDGMDTGLLLLPVLCGLFVYGFLVCGVSEDVFNRGMIISTELGRALYLR